MGGPHGHWGAGGARVQMSHAGLMNDLGHCALVWPAPLDDARPHAALIASVGLMGWGQRPEQCGPQEAVLHVALVQTRCSCDGVRLHVPSRQPPRGGGVYSCTRTVSGCLSCSAAPLATPPGYSPRGNSTRGSELWVPQGNRARGRGGWWRRGGGTCPQVFAVLTSH